MKDKSVLGTQLYSLHSLRTKQIYKSTCNTKSEEPSTDAFREAFKIYNCKGMQQSLQLILSGRPLKSSIKLLSRTWRATKTLNLSKFGNCNFNILIRKSILDLFVDVEASLLCGLLDFVHRIALRNLVQEVSLWDLLLPKLEVTHQLIFVTIEAETDVMAIVLLHNDICILF